MTHDQVREIIMKNHDIPFSRTISRVLAALEIKGVQKVSQLPESELEDFLEIFNVVFVASA